MSRGGFSHVYKAKLNHDVLAAWEGEVVRMMFLGFLFQGKVQNDSLRNVLKEV